MIILGIETSCDETSAAVVRDGRFVLSNVIRSQVDLHERYGGVVPELASRRHVTSIIPVIDLALEQAGVGPSTIDAIAVTEGPGLAGSLLVGVNVAKTLAFAWKKPLIPVNHLEGHIYANWLTLPGQEEVPEPTFPLVCLIVSGGHTELVLMKGHGDYLLLGRTLDDAAGEAFDKAARVLGLGFPGGPAIQKAAERGRPGRFSLPRAWLGESYDFSFSGLKTALLRILEQYQRRPARRVAAEQPFPEYVAPEYGPNVPIADLAAEFQNAVVEVLAEKTARAAREFGATMVLLAGGVAANAALRQRLREISPVPVRYPPPVLCTDNAAMIAGAGFYLAQRGVRADLDLDVQAQLPLVTRTLLHVATA